MLRFEFKPFAYDDDIDPRQSAASARTNFCGGAPSWTTQRRDYVDWRLENTFGGGYSRGLRSRIAAFWREPRAGVGREARPNTGFERDVAPHWAFAEQQSGEGCEAI